MRPTQNTLTFIMVLLACHPVIHRRLQYDINLIVGPPKCDPQQWSYQDDYGLLRDSMVGAVIDEVLRLFTVLPLILNTDPRQHVAVFRGQRQQPHSRNSTTVLINTSAFHRHPISVPASTRSFAANKI